jgi:hypothetical protein
LDKISADTGSPARDWEYSVLKLQGVRSPDSGVSTNFVQEKILHTVHVLKSLRARNYFCRAYSWDLRWILQFCMFRSPEIFEIELKNIFENTFSLLKIPSHRHPWIFVVPNFVMSRRCENYPFWNDGILRRLTDVSYHLMTSVRDPVLLTRSHPVIFCWVNEFN